ncbi:MAG: hypothetical protein HYY13_08210 [Nitrospirae bacterium]|nr:hypothetical protein [Nitrospirota bacterium]
MLSGTACSQLTALIRKPAPAPTRSLFQGYAETDWGMSPSEIKALYPNTEVALDEPTRDFGREGHRLVLESDEVRREFLFENEGGRLALRSLTITWDVWDEVTFDQTRTKLAREWGAPQDSQSVLGVAYDRWEFFDADRGVRIRSTLLAPRKQLSGFEKQEPLTKLGRSWEEETDVVSQTFDWVPQYGEDLPPSLYLHYTSERKDKTASPAGRAAVGETTPSAGAAANPK